MYHTIGDYTQLVGFARDVDVTNETLELGLG